MNTFSQLAQVNAALWFCQNSVSGQHSIVTWSELDESKSPVRN